MKNILTIPLQILLKGKIFIPRPKIQLLAYYILPLASLAAMVITAGFFQSQEVSKDLGSLAMNLFLVILFVSPLRQIFPQMKIFTTINGLRRELGVLCMWLSLWHGLGYPLSEGPHGIAHWWHHMQWDHFYFWGTLGLIGMLVLEITSNNYSCRLFKRSWKKIHYIVYPTFLFALLHLIILGELGYILIGIIYVSLRWLVWKKKKFKFAVIDTLKQLI
jgi:sulfoxide reductase heme-binding subunit YedZ